MNIFDTTPIEMTLDEAFERCKAGDHVAYKHPLSRPDKPPVRVIEIEQRGESEIYPGVYTEYDLHFENGGGYPARYDETVLVYPFAVSSDATPIGFIPHAFWDGAPTVGRYAKYIGYRNEDGLQVGQIGRITSIRYNHSSAIRLTYKQYITHGPLVDYWLQFDREEVRAGQYRFFELMPKGYSPEGETGAANNG